MVIQGTLCVRPLALESDMLQYDVVNAAANSLKEKNVK